MEMNIDASPCTLPDSAKGFFVGLPDAVHDGWVARIARGAMVELSAEVDDLHAESPRRDPRRPVSRNPNILGSASDSHGTYVTIISTVNIT